MATNTEHKDGGIKSALDELPLDRLKDEIQDAFKALGEKTLDTVKQRVSDATDSLNDFAENGGVLGKAAKGGGKAALEGDSPVKGALKGGLGGVKDKVKDALPGGGGKGGKGSKATKSTNIVEAIDVGVPIDVAYNQWTQFQDFSGFMKKVDGVEQEEEAKLNFKAQVFWSHRTWEATILEQVPDERIVWRSKGDKGHVDGAVTFHELGPNLTRILVVLEYYPQGFMERTGNLWRAQGRRARLELKHFQRQVMTRTILETDDLQGWRGEIHDGEVTRDHDEVVEEEQAENDNENGYDEPEDEYDDDAEDESEDEGYDESEDEYDDEEPEDEYDEGDEPEDEDSEDEYDDEEEPEDEYDEYEDDDEEEPEDDDYDEEDDVDDVADEGDEGDDEPEDEEEEPEEKPRRRSSARKTSTRKSR